MVCFLGNNLTNPAHRSVWSAKLAGEGVSRSIDSSLDLVWGNKLASGGGRGSGKGTLQYYTAGVSPASLPSGISQRASLLLKIV